MITDYQFERLSYLIDNKELTESAIELIMERISNPELDQHINWLIEWLRKKPEREHIWFDGVTVSGPTLHYHSP